MASITYTATSRRLFSGHTAGVDYSLTFGPTAIEVAHSPKQAGQHVALNGNTETVLNRIDESWQITSEPIKDDLVDNNVDQWLEFLYAVGAGESFFFNPYNITTPAAESLVIMVGTPGIKRLSLMEYFQFSFGMRVLP